MSFLLTPRIPMAAKSAPSLLYDYYNPEALTELCAFALDYFGIAIR